MSHKTNQIRRSAVSVTRSNVGRFSMIGGHTKTPMGGPLGIPADYLHTLTRSIPFGWSGAILAQTCRLGVRTIPIYWMWRGACRVTRIRGFRGIQLRSKAGKDFGSPKTPRAE